MCYDLGGSHGVKGIEVRSLFEIWEFKLLLKPVGYRIWVVPVQSLWGLKKFHSQRVKRNVTYQLKTWQKYTVYY